MRKVNSVVYHKLLLQAQEAKFRGLTKLASSVMAALGPMPEDEVIKYDYQQMHDEIYEGMWKMATHVIKYYDVESADASKIHDRLEGLADRFLQEVRVALGAEGYEVVSHKKDDPCPECGKNSFCKDCGVCSACTVCNFTTKPDFGHSVFHRSKTAAKVHRDVKNGYVSLKGGGWGMEVHSKVPPQPGDKVFIDLSYLDNPPPGESFVEEIVGQVLNEVRDIKNKVKYICSLQSQDQAERIMGGKPVQG